MVVETATVYAFSALLLIMIIIAFYFAIFYMIFYIMGGPLAYFIRKIGSFLSI